MKKLSIISVLLVVLVISISCTNASESDLLESNSLPAVVTYNANVKTIIDNNCVSCHKNTPINGAHISLTTYSNVKSAVLNDKLIARINGNEGLMPQGGPKLPQSLIDIIEKWESDGLLEN